MLSVVAQSQTFKYLDTTSEWKYYTSGGSPMSFTLSTKYFDGDTLINNKVFYKVYFKSRFVYPNNYPNPTSYTYYPDTNNAKIYYFIREDSLHNFMGLSWQNQIEMLYNFDSITHMQINDSFPKNTTYYPHRCAAYDGYNSNCTVSNKDTFYLGTQMLFGYNTNAGNGNIYNGVIEGVGSVDPYLCNWDGCPDGPSNLLHYYRKQSNTIQLQNTFPFDSFPKPIRKNKFSLLPLKLLSFSAQKENNNVLLNWQTANEVNVSHINVQRSFNNKDFIDIGKVNVGVSSYLFLDDKLPNTHDKLTLNYRLEIVDKDGSKTYSEIRQLAIDNRQMAINIFPNPAKDIVNIECVGAKQLLIIDYFGRTVHQSTVDSRPLTVNTKQLIKGIYVVKAVMNNGEIKTEKLVVE